jgi:hypothetical protein
LTPPPLSPSFSHRYLSLLWQRATRLSKKSSTLPLSVILFSSVLSHLRHTDKTYKIPHPFILYLSSSFAFLFFSSSNIHPQGYLINII